VTTLEILKNTSRSFSINIEEKTFETPFFFPAISSIKTNLTISEYLDFLKTVDYPSFLISAYDIFNSEKDERTNILKKVSESTKKGTITFLDSGNYESTWNRDKTWGIQSLEFVLKDVDIDFCFSFDLFWHQTDIDDYVKNNIGLVAKTAGMQRSGTTVPIVHSPPDMLPKIIGKIIDGINPEIIAVAERDLGASIIERAKIVKKIRDELNKKEKPLPLHLLGTGNPISLLIYTACGADMYDGLEWCKNVVNQNTGHLFHFVQKDLIECDCPACKVNGIPYHFQTMAHNLIFFEKFLKKIRRAIKDNCFNDILSEYINEQNAKHIIKIAGL